MRPPRDRGLLLLVGVISGVAVALAAMLLLPFLVAFVHL
jgi:hypothetical protein